MINSHTSSQLVSPNERVLELETNDAGLSKLPPLADSGKVKVWPVLLPKHPAMSHGAAVSRTPQQSREDVRAGKLDNSLTPYPHQCVVFRGEARSGFGGALHKPRKIWRCRSDTLPLASAAFLKC